MEGFSDLGSLVAAGRLGTGYCVSGEDVSVWGIAIHYNPEPQTVGELERRTVHVSPLYLRLGQRKPAYSSSGNPS